MKSSKGKTFVNLGWIQKISFHKFHYKMLMNVNHLISEMISQERCNILLDIGVHKGDASVQYVKKSNADLIGIDWRDERSDEYKKRFTDFHVVDLEKNKLPFEDNFFDVVVCNQVLEHIKNIYTPLTEIWRVLKPNSIFCFSVPNLASFHNRLLLAIGEQPSTIRSMGAHVRGFTMKESIRLLTYNNLFQICSVLGVGLLPLYSKKLPSIASSLAHTSVIFCKKNKIKKITWSEIMFSKSASTNFYTT